MKLLIVFLYLLTCSHVFAASVNLGLGVKRTPIAPLEGTLWSSLGVVADGVTDNTNALNTLPTGVTILADCPAGGNILVTGKWRLQTNLTVYGYGSCPIVFTDSFTTNSGTITQASINTPITNVTLRGLTLNKSVLGRLFYIYINGFVFDGNTVNHKFGFMFIRGADQRISNNLVTTGPGGSVVDSEGETFNGPGIRHLGNGIGATCPEISSSSNMPLTTWPDGSSARASVWVYGNIITSHDAGYQVAPANGSIMSGCHFLWENNLAYGIGGRSTLIDNALYFIKNVIFRNFSGSSSGEFIWLSNEGEPSISVDGISYITYENFIIDSSTMNITYTIEIDPQDGPIRNITFDNISISNPKNGHLTIQQGNGGTTENIKIINSNLQLPRLGANPCIYVLGDLNSLIITNTTIRCRGDGISLCVVSGNCAYHTIYTNTISGIKNNRFGIKASHSDTIVITNNTLTSGGSTDGGFSFSSTFTNSIVTGNTLTGLTYPIVCPPSGLDNTIDNNTGAAACP